MTKTNKKEGGTAIKKIITASPGEARVEFEHLEDWVRMKVQGFIQDILEEEVTSLLGRSRQERHKAVDGVKGYRNGHGKRRRVSLKTGTVYVKRLRIRGLEERFESRILPLFKRKTKEVGNLLPELYLHALSVGDFELALRGLLGDGASLSASSIQRLKAKWEVYIGKDKAGPACGHSVHKGRWQACSGRRERGYRESKKFWACVFRFLKERGFKIPKLIVADGHLGIWSALSEISPEVKEQRC